MADFGFGGPRGGIIQTAFTVPDLGKAIDFWIRDLKVGPWFVIRGWTGDHPVYRGEPSMAAVDIGMAFSGHMLIELLQPAESSHSADIRAPDVKFVGNHRRDVRKGRRVESGHRTPPSC